MFIDATVMYVMIISELVNLLAQYGGLKKQKKMCPINSLLKIL